MEGRFREAFPHDGAGFIAKRAFPGVAQALQPGQQPQGQPQAPMPQAAGQPYTPTPMPQPQGFMPFHNAAQRPGIQPLDAVRMAYNNRPGAGQPGMPPAGGGMPPPPGGLPPGAQDAMANNPQLAAMVRAMIQQRQAQAQGQPAGPAPAPVA